MGKTTQLAKFILRFFFDAGSGTCIWSGNEAARAKFGYAIDLGSLPIADDTIKMGNELIQLYDQSIDWDYPSNPSVWDNSERNTFNNRVNVFIEIIQNQLDSQYLIQNEYKPFKTGFRER